MKIIILLTIFFLIFNNLIYAQEPDTEEPSKTLEGIKQKMEEIERHDLERLKEEDPEGYQIRLKSIERRENIKNIVSSYNRKEITESSARSRLHPLVADEVSERIKSVDSKIEKLEKQINYLRKIKNNPLEFIEKKIDRYLGKIQPEDLPEENVF